LPKEKLKIWEILVNEGFAKNKQHAESLILSGSVLIEDRPITKSGLSFPINSKIRIREKIPEFVSRGALKIKPVIEKLNLNLNDWIAIDLGASTGGFTQVLLEKNVQKVYAIDVGYGQIAGKLRNNPRVVVLDRMHYKELTLQLIQESEGRVFISMDLSFTSIVPALQKIEDLFVESSFKNIMGLSLFKPQFESRPDELEKGIIKDNKIRFQILRRKIREIRKLQFLKIHRIIESPLPGAEGNIEYFLHWTIPKTE
jgi:23S rRNA (cytidine1920-2'-O)/16S rRNA (cytidine1409-2'-O)-methyltransferase